MDIKENNLHFIVEGRLFKSSKQYITGAEVKELAGIPLDAELYLYIREPYNDELIGNDQKVDLALPGIEGFYTKKPLHIKVDGKLYLWRKQYITGAELRKLASVPEEMDIYLDVPGNWEDNLINDNERIDLARPGIERFETRDSQVTIWVNTHPHLYNKKQISFEQVVELAYGNYNPSNGFVVSYTRGPIENPRGRMSKGDVVYVQHKMDFHVTDPHLS